MLLLLRNRSSYHPLQELWKQAYSFHLIPFGISCNSFRFTLFHFSIFGPFFTFIHL